MIRKERPQQVALGMPIAVPWMAKCMDGILEYAFTRQGTIQ